jgi:hypothetical protein
MRLLGFAAMEPTPSALRPKPWPYVGAGAVATLIYFARVVFGGLAFVDRDMRRVYLPVKRYLVERLSSGHFPDWYPYDGLGQPFVGMLVSGALHPFNALYFLLPLATACTVNVLLCYPIAFAGTWSLARRFSLGPDGALLAATLFAFNGYLVLLSNNLGYLMAASTVPWALWAADRLFCRPRLLEAAIAALLLTLVLLAGDPEAFFITGALFMAVLALRFERSRARVQLAAFAGVALLTLLFSAPQLVAALHVAVQGAAGQRTLALATTWSLHPMQLIEVLLGPIFEGFPGKPDTVAINQRFLALGSDDVWSYSYHLGAPALALASFGLWVHRRDRRSWALLATALAFLLLVLGRYGGLYAVVFKLVPPFRAFRYPGKIASYFMLAVALGAAFGLEAALVNARRRRHAARVLFSLGLACALIFGLEWLRSPFAHFAAARLGSDDAARLAIERLHSAFLAGALYTAIASLVCAAVVFAAPRHLVAALSSAALFVYLFVCNQGLVSASSPYFVVEPNGFVQTIERGARSEAAQSARVFSTEGNLRRPALEGASSADIEAMGDAYQLVPDEPALFGLGSFAAYLPGANWRVASLRKTLKPMSVALLAPLFGVRYVGANIEEAKALAPIADPIDDQKNFGLSLLRVRVSLPLAYLAEPRCVSSPEEAHEQLLHPFGAPRVALVECDRPAAPAGPGPLGSALATRSGPERIDIEADVSQPAALVVNEAYYTGWAARVDGVAASIVPANFLVQAVMLPPGKHHVELTYRTAWFWPAMWLSLFSLLLAFGLSGWRARLAGSSAQRPSNL